MTEPIKFTGYDALVATMKARRIVLGMSQLDLDDAAGIPSGYTAKLEARLTNRTAKNVRSIGWESLPLMLGALRLELFTDASNKRASKSGRQIRELIEGELKTFLSSRAEKGQAARHAKLSPRRRRAIARKAAQARWAKHRKEKAATKRSKQAEVADA